jgi:O-succinylhomoserine sulfhydrylase
MQRHCSNAQAIAEWLLEQPAIERVHYPGLASHPQRSLVLEQQQGAGGILSFELKGGKEAAWNLIDRQGLMSITANLGDTKTTITHPATTTHGRLSEEEKARSGITPGLVRISAGLENVEDLIAALDRGLG